MEEMQCFIDGLSHLPDKPRAYLVLLILTGCRKEEARMMRWADLDPISRLWRKPRTKNGTSHVVPLPVQVLEAISLLPKTSQWVFTGINGAPWPGAATSIYARLSRKATCRALQAQADRFCSVLQNSGFIEQATPSGRHGAQEVVPSEPSRNLEKGAAWSDGIPGPSCSDSL